MNHKRIAEISSEMSSLLNEQRALLNDQSRSTQTLTPEEIDAYGERNEHLRELCRELNKLG